MALTIEDGTGVELADSYLSLDDARTIATNYGLTLSDDDDTAKVQLRQGFLGVNISEPMLQGVRATKTQSGAFPREGMFSNCVEVASDSVPFSAKMAQVNFASAINGGYAVNAVSTGQDLASFNVDGVYSESYQDGSSASTNATIQGVYNALYPLTLQGYAASPCGRAAGLNGLVKKDMFLGW